jgi:uncharacterized Zn finger protein
MDRVIGCLVSADAANDGRGRRWSREGEVLAIRVVDTEVAK